MMSPKSRRRVDERDIVQTFCTEQIDNQMFSGKADAIFFHEMIGIGGKARCRLRVSIDGVHRFQRVLGGEEFGHRAHSLLNGETNVARAALYAVKRARLQGKIAHFSTNLS